MARNSIWPWYSDISSTLWSYSSTAIPLRLKTHGNTYASVHGKVNKCEPNMRYGHMLWSESMINHQMSHRNIYNTGRALSMAHGNFSKEFVRDTLACSGGQVMGCLSWFKSLTKLSPLLLYYIMLCWTTIYIYKERESQSIMSKSTINYLNCTHMMILTVLSTPYRTGMS